MKTFFTVKDLENYVISYRPGDPWTGLPDVDLVNELNAKLWDMRIRLLELEDQVLILKSGAPKRKSPKKRGLK